MAKSCEICAPLSCKMARPYAIYGKRSPGAQSLWDVPENLEDIILFDMLHWSEQDIENAKQFAAAWRSKQKDESA